METKIFSKVVKGRSDNVKRRIVYQTNDESQEQGTQNCKLMSVMEGISFAVITFKRRC